MSDSADAFSLTVETNVNASSELENETKKYLYEMLSQGASGFLFFAIPVFLMAAVVGKLALKTDDWFFYSVCIGVLAGILMTLYCLYPLKDNCFGTLADLKNRRLRTVSLVVSRAVNVLRPDSGLETIVLDCGAKSLALTGGWWRSDSYRRLLDEGAGSSFPSTSMVIKFLPTSARVVSIATNGTSLGILYEDSPSPPILEVGWDKGTELKIIETEIMNVLDSEP